MDRTLDLSLWRLCKSCRIYCKFYRRCELAIVVSPYLRGGQWCQLSRAEAVSVMGNLLSLVREHLLGRISWKRLEIETRFQWSTYRKWRIWNRTITWSMPSRDPLRAGAAASAWCRLQSLTVFFLVCWVTFDDVSRFNTPISTRELSFANWLRQLRRHVTQRQ